MKKHFLALTALVLSAGVAFAQAPDTLAKIKERGSVNLGVRDSSGLAFTLGGGKYVGFHTEMAERIVGDISKQLGKPLTINYQVITSQNRIPLIQNGTIDFECGSTTNNKTRQKDVDFVDQGPERQDRGHHHRHHLGADAAQERARAGPGLQGGHGQGPRRQLPAA